MLRQNRILIDLGAIRSNYRLFTKLVGGRTAVMCVVKADGYGHGMTETARALADEGAAHFAVATPDEGLQLRRAGIQGEILVLGAAMPRAAEEAVRHELAQTVFQPEQILLLEAEAARQGKTALVHIKLDTGMNRIGLRNRGEAQQLAQALEQSPHVRAAGLYTHFAAADLPDESGGLNAFSRTQLERFHQLRACFDPSLPAHAANSAAALMDVSAHFSMVREGIALYGYPPVPTAEPFRRALSWVTEVVHVKRIEAGESVGYGCAYIAERPMRLATVAVGYGDGYHRALSGRGWMLIGGKRVPIVGRVCMDQTMADVSEVPEVCAGDEAVLIGRQGQESIGADEVAAWAGTISYEVLLAATQRVQRIWLDR